MRGSAQNVQGVCSKSLGCMLKMSRPLAYSLFVIFLKIMESITEPHLTNYLLEICGYSGIELQMTEVLPDGD